MRTIQDRAWTAGVIDGEGCITVVKTDKKRRRHPQYYLRVNVAMVHLPTLQKVQTLFGGTIYCKRSADKKHRTAWIWSCGSQEAATLLKAIAPFSLTKKSEVDLALLFVNRKRLAFSKGGLTPEMLEERESLYLQLRSAKRYEFHENPILDRDSKGRS